MHIAPYERRKGVGTLLLSTVDEYARQIDVEYLYLSTGVTYDDAIQFYTHLGFTRICGKKCHLYLVFKCHLCILVKKFEMIIAL